MIQGIVMLRDKIILKLKERKEELCITYDAIAKRSSIGVATVKRVFKGDDVSIGKIEKIVYMLELDDDFKPKISASAMRQKEIEKKAHELISRIIHTSRLEAQTPSSKVQKMMLQETIKKLSMLPNNKVWQ